MQEIPDIPGTRPRLYLLEVRAERTQVPHPIFRLDLAAGDGYDEAMLRNARVVIPRVAHHVARRGNHRQDVFQFRLSSIGDRSNRCSAV
jgi:hypothetical protein